MTIAIVTQIIMINTAFISASKNANAIPVRIVNIVPFAIEKKVFLISRPSSRFSTILSFLHALTNIRRPMPNRIRIASILPIKASPLSCVSYWFRRVTKKLPMRSAIVCHKAITVTAMDKRFFSSFATNAP